MKNSGFSIGRVVVLSTLALVLALSGCPVGDTGDDNDDALALKSGEDGLLVNLTQKSLTVTFNKKITEVDGSKVKVYSTNLSGTGKVEVTGITVAVNKLGQLVIILDSLDPAKKYYAELDQGAVKAGSESLAAKKATESDAVLETPVVTKPADNQLVLAFANNVVAESFVFDKTKITVSPSSATINRATILAKRTLTITFDSTIPTGGVTLTFAQGAFSATSEPFVVEFDTSGPVWNKIVPVVNLETRVFLVGFGEKITLATSPVYVLERTPKGGAKKTVGAGDYNAVIDSNVNLKFTITNASEVVAGDTFILTINKDSVQDVSSNKNAKITLTGISVEDRTAPKASSTTITDKVITVTFDENITLDNSKVEIRSKASGAASYPSSALEVGAGKSVISIARDSTDKKLVKVTLMANPTAGDSYQVKFLANAVKDDSDNGNTEAITTAVVVPGVPDTTPPGLGGTGNDGDSALNQEFKTITVTLSEVIKTLDSSKVKIKVGGATKQDGTAGNFSAGLKVDDKTKAVLTFNPFPAANSSVVVVFEAGALTDTADNTNGGGDLETSAVTIPVPDTTPPTITSLAIADNVITVTFSEDVKITDNSKINVRKGVTGLASNDYEIEDRTLLGRTQTITIFRSLIANEEYGMIYERNSFKDAAGLGNVVVEKKIQVVTPYDGNPPTVKPTEEMRLNIITVHFSRNVRIDNSGVKVERSTDGGTIYSPVTGSTLESVTNKNSQTVEFTSMRIGGHKYKVTYEIGALADATSAKNKNRTEQSVVNTVDTTPPTKRGDTIDATNKSRLKAPISEAVTIFSGNNVKIESYSVVGGQGSYSDVTDTYVDTATKTLEFDSTDSVNSNVFIHLKTNLISGSYRVTILADALEDLHGNKNGNLQYSNIVIR